MGSLAKEENGTPNPDAIDISVALSPCDIEAVPGLVQDIVLLEKSSFTSNEKGVRVELLEKARSLVRALETPRETMIKHCWGQASQFQVKSTEKAAMLIVFL